MDERRIERILAEEADEAKVQEAINEYRQQRRKCQQREAKREDAERWRRFYWDDGDVELIIPEGGADNA